MAEEKQEKAEQEKPKVGVPEQKPKEKEKEKAKAPSMDKEMATAGKLIRILQTDIPGNKNLYTGLTRIKGVYRWCLSYGYLTRLRRYIRIRRPIMSRRPIPWRNLTPSWSPIRRLKSTVPRSPASNIFPLTI